MKKLNNLHFFIDFTYLNMVNLIYGDSMSYENMRKLRKILVEELSIYEGDPVLLTLDKKLLKKLFFDENEFSNDIKSIIEKIDFSNIPFDGYNCHSKDFSKLTGVKINPQKSYNKDLSCSNYKNVEFIGKFDGVKVMGSMYGGSKGAIINPQTIPDKNLSFSEYADVTFKGSFNGANVVCADFTGSTGAIIDPQEVKNKNLSCTNCHDVEFTNDFDGVKIDHAKFEGSNYDEIIAYEENFRKEVKSMIIRKVIM